MSDSFLRALRNWSVLAFALSATILYAERTAAQGRAPTQYIRQAHHSGVIATRAVVRRDEGGQIVRRQSGVPYSSSAGNPQWILYGRTGFLSANPQLPNGLGSRPDTDVLSVSEYQGHAARLQEVLSDPANAERTTLTVQEYMQSPCAAARPLTSVGARFGTFHVIVRNVPPQQVVCSDYVLLETPINTGLPAPQIGADHASMLFSKDTHEILFSTPEVIARETAFYLAGEGAPHGCAQTGTSILDGDFNAPSLERCKLTSSQAGNNDIDNSLHLFAPVVGALVWMPDITGFVEAYTDDNGAYDLPYLYYRIPGDYDIFDYSVTAQIFVATPNRRVSRAPTYWLRGGDHHPVGVSDFTNWPVDTTLLGGELRLMTVFPHGIHPGTSGAAEIGVGPETRFSTTPVAPDCQRQPGQPIPAGCFDYGKNFVHQGLLSAIDVFDLRDTDIYVYRVSDGQMLGRRWMLSPNEVTPGEPAAVFVNQMRGLENWYVDNEDRYTNASGDRVYKPWQPLSLQLDYTGEEGRRRNPLRTGDVVKVVAINRPTGYIGSVTQTVEGGAGGLASLVLHQTLALGPPNLRITARRTWVPKEGASANESRKSIIGGEGAAMATDEAIVIDTEWYDRDGSPLPQDLPGFTGRLARVCSAGEQGGSATLANAECAGGGEDAIELFKIEPGHQTEVIQLPAGSLSAKGYYYVQIDGTDFDVERPYDPETIKPGPFCYYIGTELICNARGAGEGPLLDRPATFVPVLVPYYDRGATEVLKQRYEDGELDEEPKPVYRWVYRPEMHFSLFELEVQELERTDHDGQTHDLLPLVTDGKAETGVLLGDNVSGLDLVALLAADANESLQRVGTSRDVYLRLGDQEVSLTLTPGQPLDLGEEELARLDPNDLLTLQLVQRYDEGNPLWELTFDRVMMTPYLVRHATSAQDILVPTDDPIISISALRLGFVDVPEGTYTAEWRVEPEGVAPITPLSNTLSTPLAGHSARLDLSNCAPGTRARVKFVIDGNNEFYSAWFRVVPGSPAAIVPLGETGATAAGGLGEVVSVWSVQDVDGNHVATGTPVTYELEDDLDVQLSPAVGANGTIELRVRGGATSGAKTVTLVAGTVRRAVPINVRTTTLVLNVPNVMTNGTQTATVRLDAAVALTEPVIVELVASRVGLNPKSVSLLPGQSAQVSVLGGPAAGPATFIAKLGPIMASAQFTVLQAPNTSFASTLILAGDKTGVATFTVDDVNDQGQPVSITHRYPTSTQVTLVGTPGEERTVNIGDWETPNHDAALAYSLTGFASGSSTNSGYIAADVGPYLATVDVVEVSADAPPARSRSLRFTRFSRITIPSNDDLAIPDDIGATFYIRPTSPVTAGRILDIAGSGLELTLNTDARISLTLRTSGGGAVVVTSAPLGNAWHRVGAHHTDGRLVLSVDGDVHEAAAPQAGLNQQSSKGFGIRLGDGFAGNLQDFALVDWSSDPILEFDDHSLQKLVTYDAAGRAVVNLVSTGRLGSAQQRFASTVPMRRGGASVDTAHAQGTDLNYMSQEQLVYNMLGLNTVGLDDLIKKEVELRVVRAGTWAKMVVTGVVTGNCDENAEDYVACLAADFAVGLTFWGDLRDLAKQGWYGFRSDPQYSGALAAVAALGLAVDGLQYIAAACAVATAETIVGGIVCAKWAVALAGINASLAIIKQTVKVLSRNPARYGKLLAALEGFAERAFKGWFPPKIHHVTWTMTGLQFAIIFYHVGSTLTPEQWNFLQAAFFASVDNFVNFVDYWSDVIATQELREEEETASLAPGRLLDVAYAQKIRPRSVISEALETQLRTVFIRVTGWAVEQGVSPIGYQQALALLKKMAASNPSLYDEFIASSDVAADTLSAMAVVAHVGGGTEALEKFILREVATGSLHIRNKELMQRIARTKWREVLYDAAGSKNAAVEEGLKKVFEVAARSPSQFAIRHAHMIVDALHEITTNPAKWPDARVLAVEAKRVDILGAADAKPIAGREYDLVISSGGRTLRLETKTWGEFWLAPGEGGHNLETVRHRLKSSLAPKDAAPSVPVAEVPANQLAADAVATHSAGPTDPLSVLLLPFGAGKELGVDATTTLLLSDARVVVIANREWYMAALGIRPPVVNGRRLSGAKLEKWWAEDTDVGAPAVIERLKARGFIRFMED